MDEVLSTEEMQLWVAWKRATDAVWDQVVRQINAETGLSAADFAVLTRVVEADDPVRQQQLADALGWQRSRLSRQLTRMAERGLLERTTTGDSTRVVRATAAGRKAGRRARTAHARAVRAALLREPAVPAAGVFWDIIRSLGSPK